MRHSVVLVSVIALACTSAQFVACSSNSNLKSGSDGGVGNAAGSDRSMSEAISRTGIPLPSFADAGSVGCDDGGACTVPPQAPTSGTTAPGTTSQNFAMHHIHLGDELDSTGNPNWYLYGYNIDGKDTVASSTNVCTQYASANAKNQDDGPGGIDNSFGENFVSLLEAVISNYSASLDTSLAEGNFTFLMNVTGLSSATAQSSTGLSAQIFHGLAFGQGPNASNAVPTFTTADNWPINPSDVTSPISGPTLVTPIVSKVTLSGAYVNDGVFVGGSAADTLTLTLTLQGSPLTLPIQHPTITFNHVDADAGTSSTHLSGGIISGVIDAQTLVNNLHGIAGNVESALCTGSVFQQVATTILQEADIMDDGSNQPGTPCNGISIGIGFDADEIGLPQVVGTVPTPPNPCGAGVPCTGPEDAGVTEAGAPCQTGLCVDGVCCYSTCSGQCGACNVPENLGICTAVTGAPVGDRTPCSTGDAGVCGGECNGTNTNACVYATSGTQCIAASCANGVQTAAASCTGEGTCPAAVATPCTPYLCGATACKTTCTGDTDCIAGDWCKGTACVAKASNGTACTGADQCTNGECVDGFCCNSACGEQCQACDVTGSQGTCTTVTGKPQGSRSACGTASSDPTCGVESCNGTDATECHAPASGTTCGSAGCTSGTQTSGGTCNGTGTCSQTTKACAPYACGTTACKTTCASDGDCASGDWCSGTTCVPQATNGTTCTGADQCTTGNCIDGVCCNTTCAGQCQACNLATEVGTCSAVTGAPVGTRTACATDGATCGGTCNGTDVTTCTYPTTQCRAASCASGTETTAASCNGAGACPAAVTTKCAPYVCGATACKTSCSGTSDCSDTDATCVDGGVCQGTLSNGATCSSANDCTSGNCVDGVCCNTACNGQCEACGVTGEKGTCTAVTGAPQGGRTACGTASSDPTCGAEACNGTDTAACHAPVNGTACGSASCSGSTLTAAGDCNGTGTCTAGATTSCAPYACSGTACKTSCSTSSDCVSGDTCTGGVCSASTGTDGGGQPDASTSDGGGVVATDAGIPDGSTSASDAAVGAEGGTASGNPGSSSGCGCSVPGVHDEGNRYAALGIGAMALVLARRRRRGEADARS